MRLLHVDVARPEFQNCPGGQSFENIKYEGYYAWKLPALKVKDNDQDSFIEQSVVFKQKGENTLLSAYLRSVLLLFMIIPLISLITGHDCALNLKTSYDGVSDPGFVPALTIQGILVSLRLNNHHNHKQQYLPNLKACRSIIIYNSENKFDNEFNS